LHQARNEWKNSIFPMVPGHEIAGIVSKVGSQVTKFKPGDHVGVGCFVDSCRNCEWCKHNSEQLCAECVFTYNHRSSESAPPTFGGYSNCMVVDESYVYQMPSNLPLNKAAPLLCAGITMYSPLKQFGAGPGKHVGIVGMGGLGHVGVKIAKKMGAEVTVLSQTLRKQEDGVRLGADHFYATSDPKTFEKLKCSFDVIINTVSADVDYIQYSDLLKPYGTIVAVGIPETEEAKINIAPFVMKRRTLAGSLIGGLKETQEMLDFCGTHNITCDVEEIPIQKVNEAYERVLKSDVRYRFVINMSTLSEEKSS